MTGATLTSNGVNDMLKECLKDAGLRGCELFIAPLMKQMGDSTAVEPKEKEE